MIRELVTVAVRAGDGVVRVEVTDRSGPQGGRPQLCRAGRDDQAGRGLQLAAGLVTWFEPQYDWHSAR